jgi:uncharacterized protein YkwD
VKATTAHPSYLRRAVFIAGATAVLAVAAPAPALASAVHPTAHLTRCVPNQGRRRQRRCPVTRHVYLSRKRSRRTAAPIRDATRQTPASIRHVPCTNADLVPTPSNIPEIRAAILCLINQQRAQNGLAPLKDNGRLDNAAEQHSEDMVANNYFDHTEPGGKTFDSRIMATGYVPGGWDYMLGENIAVGTLQLATPAAIVGAWMSSPEHRANILAEFRDSGLGIVAQAPAEYASGQPGATYTEDFGAVQSNS